MRTIFSLLIIYLFPLNAAADWKDEFGREFGRTPWAGSQVQQDVCIECHSSYIMKPEWKNIPREWETSVHSQNGISCANCHGGDPTDAENAMLPQKGFVGTPTYVQVPDFCGKCHVGILKNFQVSGHGRALRASGKGPNCVTCHGNHGIRKASINIINEQLCTRCHSYERVKIMKQALFVTENKMYEIEKSLTALKSEGVFIEPEEKTFFSAQAQFRTLFHTEDVNLVKKKTDEFGAKLDEIQSRMQKTFQELRFRRDFSGYLMMIFIGLSVGFFLLSRSPKK